MPNIQMHRYNTFVAPFEIPVTVDNVSLQRQTYPVCGPGMWLIPIPMLLGLVYYFSLLLFLGLTFWQFKWYRFIIRE